MEEIGGIGLFFLLFGVLAFFYHINGATKGTEGYDCDDNRFTQQNDKEMVAGGILLAVIGLIMWGVYSIFSSGVS